MKLLATLLQKLFGGMGKRVLVGAGLGLASGAIVLNVVNFYIGKITSQAGALGAMAGILHLAGVDTAISIVIGACVVRASISATKLSLIKAGR